MNKKLFLEYLKDIPDNYDLVLSEYTILPRNDDIEEEDYIVVYDIPLRGVTISDDTKEIRFLCLSSEEKALEVLSTKIKDLK